MGISLPQEMRQGKGFSRFEKLYQDRVIREIRSWKERILAVEKQSSKYVSQGWNRTANATIAVSLEPKFSLSSVDKSYAYINNNPYEDGFIELYMKINSEWKILYFHFDKERFSGSYKISLPDVTIQEGKIKFHFATAYEYNYSEISSEYVIAVDVGKTNYATMAVIRASDNSLVEGTETTLSQRVHSLHNSCVATAKQISQLQKQGRKQEAKLHRKANVKKKRELAILAAQEITDLAFQWDNAVVVVEDLSWQINTMQNGRWNRGELLKWINHYCNLNGSRMFKVDAKNTSQKCHKCHQQLIFKDWHNPLCINCNVILDRDVNACINIGNRFINNNTLKKVVSTRKKSKSFTKSKFKRTPKTRNSLSYPGRDRTKNVPTPPRKKNKLKKIIINKEVTNNNQCSTISNNDLRVIVDSHAKHTLAKTATSSITKQVTRNGSLD